MQQERPRYASAVRKLDVFNHIYPKAYFDLVMAVAPTFKDIGKRMRSIPMLIDLDAWVTKNEAPPADRMPRVADGTLAPPQPQAGMGFPTIPGVVYNGVHHTGDLFDFGPDFDKGFISVQPPKLVGSPYQVLVPKTDADGNDVAGLRLPDVSVPTATYTGWALRADGLDGCDANGQPLRCRAMTRKGSACQRMPLPHNGYCPSHQHLAETEDSEADVEADRGSDRPAFDAGVVADDRHASDPGHVTRKVFQIEVAGFAPRQHRLQHVRGVHLAF